MNKLLIANRAEIALRIQRAAHNLGLPTVAVYAQDDAASRHAVLASEALALPGTGPAAYLDMAALLELAARSGCDALHPGYGFLSERADFAQACVNAGLCWVGPAAEHLALFGDKARALALARECQVPVMPSTPGNATLPMVEAFFQEHAGAGIVIKAVGGGGGRGMRVVRAHGELAQAYARCRSEAMAAFGIDGLYAERLVARARHIEVQVIGDGHQVMALGERDCTVQRRFQKLVEIAPSPVLSPALRSQLVEATCAMAQKVRYRSLCTFEFLIEQGQHGQLQQPVFIEANPRLQVEHTVTEQVLGLDLVALQLGLARGHSLAELGLNPGAPPQPRGYAIQWRINAENTDAQGQARPASGRLQRFEPPSGPDVRVDTHASTGYAPPPGYDSLLAKLVVSCASPKFADVLRRCQRALDEFEVAGLGTNLNLLRALVRRADFAAQQLHNGHFEAIAQELLEAAQGLAGAQPHGASAPAAAAQAPRSMQLSAAHAPDLLPEPPRAAGHEAVRAPLSGRVVEMAVMPGEQVRAGQTLAVLDAMKMEHSVQATTGGTVVSVHSDVNAQALEGQLLLVLQPAGDDSAERAGATALDLDHIRPDLQRVLQRQACLEDAARPQAVARRRERGQRTARENVAALFDDGSFVEYGGLALAAQASRRSVQDLIANTPADGLITGIGTINAAQFGPERARSAVMAYDATVLAGTQGKRNHVKTDRIVEVALRDQLPLVLFAEGGGGRPGDVDVPSVSGLWQPAFAAFAGLSGEVPVVGIVSGRCFAGNAAFLGCCDVIIADQSANIGMAGPAMIEGGGLGVFKPEDVGPAPVQHRNGVIDILVANELEAVRVARHYLGLFRGPFSEWQAPDQRALRQVVPENRLRVYDSRGAIEGLADVGTVLHLRTGFGLGIHTALARVEGRSVGIMASNPQHLGGAIDADAADKAARFMMLCDAHGLPIVSLIDTPGFMVGPQVEAQAQVRHVSRMFLVAAKLRVALLAITLRKGYGLGAMAMAGGGFRSAEFTVSWPSGEFGPMGLEGAVRLGFKKELDALPEGAQRRELYEQLVAQAYERGHALNVAAAGEIDAVIDPAHTRAWVAQGLASAAMRARRPRRPFVDAW